MYPTFISGATPLYYRRKVLLSELHVKGETAADVGRRTSRYNIYNISTFISAEKNKHENFSPVASRSLKSMHGAMMAERISSRHTKHVNSIKNLFQWQPKWC